MTATNLTEEAVDLIIDAVRTNIEASLNDVRSRYSDNSVTVEPPRSYFFYERPYVFEAPGVFVIPIDLDFNLPKGANHISAKLRVNVAAVVEERDKINLSRKCWRYQVALYDILNETRLTSADNSLVLVVKVLHARFTPEYTTAGKEGNTGGFFRKEVHLECEVEHWENF